MEYAESNLRVGSQLEFCAYPLTMDLYKGCPHRCAYCFSNGFNRNRNKHKECDDKTIFNNIIPMKFDNIIEYINNNKECSDPFIKYFIQNKQPIHIGGMYDPFPINVEENLQHSRRFINSIGEYPVIISTKNPLWADDFIGHNIILQCSVIGIGDNFERIETGVLPAIDRLNRLKEFKNKASKIIVRLQPFIPSMYTDESLEELIKHVADVADGLIIEFLHVSISSLNLYKLIFNIDNNQLEMKGNELVYKNNIKDSYIQKTKELCNKYNLQMFCGENSHRNYGCSIECCGINSDDNEIFHSKNIFNSGNIFRILKERNTDRIKVSEYIKEFDIEPFNKISALERKGLNPINYKHYSRFKQMTEVERIKHNLTTKCGNCPAVMYKDIILKKIDDELYFINKEADVDERDTETPAGI